MTTGSGPASLVHSSELLRYPAVLLSPATFQDEQTEEEHRLDRYVLQGLIATGGMAELHIGRVRGPAGFEQFVVIKQILPHLARDPAFVSMFLDEARIAARIRHPNVVSVLDLVQTSSHLYLVMEYLRGEALSLLRRRLTARRRAFPWHLAVYVAMEACKGLHAAHEAKDHDGEPLGVVHRDVSPSNLLVTFDGAVKVVDFGIAKAAGRATKTDTGTFKGKLAYCAPEHLDGQGSDRRSDLFSLAVVLHEMLTGVRLFRRDSQAETIRAVLHDEAPLVHMQLTEAPPELDAVLAKALKKSPDERYPTLEAFRSALATVVATRPELAVDPGLALGQLMRAELADRAEAHIELLHGEPERTPEVAIPLAPASPSSDPSMSLSRVDIELEQTATRASKRPRALRVLGVIVPLGILLGLGWLGLQYLAQPGVNPSPEAEPARVAPEAGPFASPSVEPSLAPPSELPSPEGVPEAALVQVHIATHPLGATIQIDGVRVGETPLDIEVRPSAQVRLSIEKEGYQPQTREVDLTRDATLVYDLRR